MIGFLVDEVREVVNIALTDIEKPTFKLDEDNASFLAGIGKKGDTLISLLDIMAIEEEKEEALSSYNLQLGILHTHGSLKFSTVHTYFYFQWLSVIS